MGPCIANARRPTVDSRCRGTTISCCVSDLRRCLPTTSVTGVQQSTRYCRALPCRHQCMMTPSLYVTRSATSSQCKSSCKIWVRSRSNFLDDTCGSVHNTLQSVSDRLRGPSKYGIALVNTGGYECVNKCSRWLRVKWSSDTSELTQPIKAVADTLDTWRCRLKSDEIVTPSRRTSSCAVTVSAPSWRDGRQTVTKDWLCLDPALSSSVFSVFNFSRLADIHW